MGRLSDLRTFASLSPRLLARKGGARPAMRSQLNAQPSATASSEYDLGWNDMGPANGPEPILQSDADDGQVLLQFAPLRQAEVISINPAAAALAAMPAPVTSAESDARTSRRSASSQGRRAAFTLRLDADRHLKLRLASAVRNRSAQQLLVEALDRMISDNADVENLAAQVTKRS